MTPVRAYIYESFETYVFEKPSCFPKNCTTPSWNFKYRELQRCRLPKNTTTPSCYLVSCLPHMDGNCIKLIFSQGHNFAEPLHKDTYPAIDPQKANLTGKSVFITGASKGVGKAMALSFAKAGASFIGVGARSKLESLEKAIKEAAAAAGQKSPQVLPITLDVTSQKSVDDAAFQVKKNFGKLDILVNNAGVLEPPTPIAESDPDTWWNTWVVNVRGPYLSTRAFLPLLLKGDHKQIINTCSVGAFATMQGASAYQSGKLALLRFTEFTNAEYGDKGVLAYAIHPGAILTEIFDPMGGLPEEFKPRKSKPFHGACGFKERLANSLVEFQDTPELAADTVVFLASEKPDWLAGRYISCTWDMPQLMSKKDQIVKGDKLKVRMAV